MAFSVFRNPFEALSAENQSSMVKNLTEIRDYFFSCNTIVEAINVLSDQFKAFINKQDKITDFLLKRDSKQMSDKDQKEMVKTAKIFGQGLKLIVDSIKVFSKIPEEVVDKFVLSIEKIGRSFVKMAKINRQIERGSAALLDLGKSILIFGLLMIAALPIYIIAAITAPLVILIVSGIIYLFTKLISKNAKDIGESSKYLMYMAASIILFGIALLIAAQLYGQILSGAAGIIAIVLTITAVVFFFKFIKSHIKDIREGAEMLAVMAIVILGFGLILLLAGLVYAQLWTGVLGMFAILLTISAVVGLMFLIDKLSDSIYDGIRALALTAMVIVGVGLILYISTFIYDKLYEGMIDSWPIFVVIGALVGIMFLIDKMKSNIYQGSLALLIMVFSLGITALILYLISDLGDKMKAGLGASWPILILLGALVFIMAGISSIKGQLLQGALALGAISIAVLILSAALLVFKSSGFGLGDTIVLTALIIALGTIGTVLGVLMEAGMLPLLGAAALAAIGLALLPLSYALKVYKESGITTEDTIIFGLLVGAFALLATELGGLMLFGGLPLLGAAAMGAIGLALVPFTESLLVFKNSKFSETDSDNFINVIEKIIGGLSDVFSKFTQDQLLKINKGVSALTGVGAVMSGLATGIQNFANMKFIEYEVVKNKDGISKIQPKSINKLSDTDIINAGINFGKVIDAISNPLRGVGIAETTGSGIFKGGYVSKGVKALTGIGNIMTGLAQGVQAFANMTFTEYEVVGKGSNAKIVPKAVVPIDMETTLPKVTQTFTDIVTAMTDPLRKVGSGEAESEGWFNGGHISKGIKALTGIGNVMTDLAKGVQNFANLTFQQYKLDEKTGKLVYSGSPVKMTLPYFKLAKANLQLAISSIIDPVISAGLTYKSNEDVIDSFINFMPKITKGLSGITGLMDKFSTNPKIDLGEYFKRFFTSILDIFNNKDYLVAGLRFKTFTSNADILIKGSDKLEKVASSFERIADAFGEMKDHINGMELARLTQVTKLMGFLDGLANGKTDDIVAQVGESITLGMQALKDILEEIKDELGKGGEESGLLDKAANALGIGPGTVSKPAPVQAKPETSQKIQDMGEVVRAVENLRVALLESGIKIKGSNPLLSF